MDGERCMYVSSHGTDDWNPQYGKGYSVGGYMPNTSIKYIRNNPMTYQYLNMWNTTIVIHYMQ